MALIERWLPVVGYEGLYEVSDLGRVCSVDHVITVSATRWGAPCQRRVRGHMMTPAPGSNGYLKVTLSCGGREMQATPAVHQLVLEAFVGPCPAGQQARHGPGGQQDNRLVNLSYGTPPENAADKVRDGTHVHGILSVHAKLTDDIVRECRERYAAGTADTVSLAAEFGVSQYGMWLAVNRRSWKHVTA